MAGFEKERTNIYSHFASNFRSAKIQWENQKPNFIPENEECWVRLTIVNGSREQISMGDKKLIRSIGIVFVSIFTTENKGTTLCRQNADNVATIFDCVQIEQMQFRTAQINELGSTNGFYQINVQIPFFRNEYI